MEEDESRGYEVAGHLPAALVSPAHTALADAPAEEQAQGHHVQDGRLEGRDAQDSGLLEPHARAEVEVEEEDGDREDEGSEDSHPYEDVEEEAEEPRQPGHHHHSAVHGKSTEQILDAVVNLNRTKCPYTVITLEVTHFFAGFAVNIAFVEMEYPVTINMFNVPG